jgi:hypothetical protein
VSESAKRLRYWLRGKGALFWWLLAIIAFACAAIWMGIIRVHY